MPQQIDPNAIIKPRVLLITELTPEAKCKLEAAGGSLYTVKYAGIEVIHAQLPAGTKQEGKYYVLPDGTKLEVRTILEVSRE